MLEKKDYENAIKVQGACNLSGVVHSFNEIIYNLWDEAHDTGKGTDWVNTHPICRMYAEQVLHLTRSKKQGYLEAYRICMEKGEC